MATVPVVGADVGGTPVQFFFVGDASTGSECPGSTARCSLAVRYPGSTAGRIAAAAMSMGSGIRMLYIVDYVCR